MPLLHVIPAVTTNRRGLKGLQNSDFEQLGQNIFTKGGIMGTEKQDKANRENAKTSTGPKTEAGKAIVAQNAIKHGIFSRDLIIPFGVGKENLDDFNSLHQNLIDDFSPMGQFQSILVEKITVDIWRLIRVMRFETGCIRLNLDTGAADYYKETQPSEAQTRKTNKELDIEIKQTQNKLDYNLKYIQYLKEKRINFELPFWQTEDFKIDIEKELDTFFYAKKLDTQSNLSLISTFAGKINFSDIRDIIKRNHFTDDDIRDYLVVCAERENARYQKEIFNLEKQKEGNSCAEEISVKVRSIPQDNFAERTMRYERAIQKSISHNVMLLRNLQSNR